MIVRICKSILYLVWKVWFYILVAIPIFIFFPVLLVLSSKEKWYPHFFWFARNLWANIILYGMGFYPKIYREEQFITGKSYMLVANHTSMLDIMLMLKASSNPFVFVGKQELAKLPVFGFFYKRVCILVDRNNANSRSAVYKKAKARLNGGLSICIFPEGGVPEDDVFLDVFKDGAFRLALEYKIPIVPITLADNKQRFPYIFLKGSPGITRAMIHTFIDTSVYGKEDKELLKTKTRNIILQQLMEFQKKCP